MTSLQVLQTLNDQKISSLPTPLLENLVKKFNRELSKRREKNPITALYEWSNCHPERIVGFEFAKLEGYGWVCVVRARDENGKEYSVEGTNRFTRLAKKTLKKEVALELYLQIY